MVVSKSKKEEGVIAQRYTQLAILREPYLRRARACSALSEPDLIPPEGATSETELPIPYQDVAADGLANLSSHMNTIMFPVGSPWFRFSPSDEIVEEAEKNDEAKKVFTDAESQLSKREETIRKYCEKINLRACTAEAFDQEIVGGNALLFIPMEEKPVRCYSMDRYVLKRDRHGEMQEAIIREEVLVSTLEKDVRSHCGLAEDDNNVSEKAYIYTQVKPDDEKKEWLVKQEINGVILPEKGVGESEEGKWAKYPYALCPYVPTRWKAKDGKTWSRSYMNSLLGSIISLDVLSRSITEGSQIAAMSLIGVRPGGPTKLATLRKARNGDIVSADFNSDVSVLRSEKQGDFSVAERFVYHLTERLERAFLQQDSVQRKGERVTAYEISAMIKALEERIGPIYENQSAEKQSPIVNLIIKRMEKLGKLTPLPDGLVDTTIVTGLEALGRGRDLQKLMQFAEVATKLFGPQVLAKYTKPHVGLVQIATSLQYDPKDFVLSDDEVKQMMEREAQERQQQMMMQLASPAANIISKGMENRNVQQQPEQSG